MSQRERSGQTGGQNFQNLGRLYRLPEARDNDDGDTGQRHREALRLPHAPHERAMVSMLGGWLLYADAHQNTTGSDIRADAALGNAWARIGQGLRGLLAGDLGRLDAGTLDAILTETLSKSDATE